MSRRKKAPSANLRSLNAGGKPSVTKNLAEQTHWATILPSLTSNMACQSCPVPKRLVFSKGTGQLCCPVRGRGYDGLRGTCLADSRMKDGSVNVSSLCLSRRSIVCLGRRGTRKGRNKVDSCCRLSRLLTVLGSSRAFVLP